jgi:hypothetical protein
MASAWGNRTLVARMSVAICGTNRCGEDEPGYRFAHPGNACYACLTRENLRVVQLLEFHSDDIARHSQKMAVYVFGVIRPTSYACYPIIRNQSLTVRCSLSISSSESGQQCAIGPRNRLRLLITFSTARGLLKIVSNKIQFELMITESCPNVV